MSSVTSSFSSSYLLLWITFLVWTSSGHSAGWEFETIYCNHSVRHDLLAEDQMKVKTVSLSAWPAPPTWNETDLRAQCLVWTVKALNSRDDLVVIINNLVIVGNDLIFVISERPQHILRFDSNVTGHDQGAKFPKEVTSNSPLTLLWVQLPGADNGNADRQILTFSYIIAAESNADFSEDEKEQFVLIAFIVISSVTVMATIVSITRSTGCRCFRRGACINLKRSAINQHNSTVVDMSGTRNDAITSSEFRGCTRQAEETLNLLQLENRGHGVRGQGASPLSSERFETGERGRGERSRSPASETSGQVAYRQVGDEGQGEMSLSLSSVLGILPTSVSSERPARARSHSPSSVMSTPELFTATQQTIACPEMMPSSSPVLLPASSSLSATLPAASAGRLSSLRPLPFFHAPPTYSQSPVTPPPYSQTPPPAYSTLYPENVDQ